jgi:hypothetical protein
VEFSDMLTLLSLGTAGHLVAPRSLALATQPRAAVSMVATKRATSAKDELLSLSTEGLKPMDDGAPRHATPTTALLAAPSPTLPPSQAYARWRASASSSSSDRHRPLWKN